MIKENNNKYISSYTKNEISKTTGFKKSKIILILSKRTYSDSPTLDYHKFIYENKNYILIDKHLKCIN